MLVSYTLDGDCSDDLHLLEGSPLIDAGDPSTTDEDGTVADIGAHGTAAEEEPPEDTGGDTGEEPVDTGPGDTGPVETGTPDTNPPDTSPPDSGPTDSNPGETAPADTEPQHSDEAATDSDEPGPKPDGCACSGGGEASATPRSAQLGLLALLFAGSRRRRLER